MPKPKRKLGAILLELETILDELVAHDLQWGDVLSLVHSHLMVHRPDAREEYEDGGHPIFFYGADPNEEK